MKLMDLLHLMLSMRSALVDWLIPEPPGQPTGMTPGAAFEAGSDALVFLS